MNQDPMVNGMTVNERLFHLGLVEDFEAAIRSGQLPEVIQVLVRAQLSETQARQTAEAVLASPKRYGL